MDDDGSGAPLPYLGYLVFACADEVHEDDENQYIFATSRDLAEATSEAESEVVDPEADEGDMEAEAIAEAEFEVDGPVVGGGDMEAEAIAEAEFEVDDPAADEGDMGAEAMAEAEFEVDDPAADEGDLGAEAIAEAEFEVDDPAADEGDMDAEAYREIALRSRAQLTALKQYVLKKRVFYVLIHTDRRQYADEDMSSDVILLALGVSPAT
ncbi:unnamed protein product, partial [Ectocarpus sp. 12 AP-2014]